MLRINIVVLISSLYLVFSPNAALAMEHNHDSHRNNGTSSDVSALNDHSAHDMSGMVNDRKKKDSSALSALVDISLEPKFTLQLTDGTNGIRTVTEGDFRGQYLLISFGFTHCAHVCPTLLSDLSRMMGLLPEEKREKVTVLFVTLDPARDTPAITDAYAKNFNSKFVGLSGSLEQVDALAKNLRITYLKVPVEDSYRIDHTSISYLVTPEREVATLFGFGSDPHQVADRVAGVLD